MRAFFGVWWAAVFLAQFGSAWANELKLFVSPNGNDSWEGTAAAGAPTGQPGAVRTIARAQQLARVLLDQMRVGDKPKQSIRVVLAPGDYQLPRPLIFEPEDSGFANFPVIYEAETPGTVVLSGGIKLANKPVVNGVVSFHAPAGQSAAILGGGQLFVQGQRAVLARMPNAGSYWFVDKPVAIAGAQGEPGRDAFLPEKSAQTWLAALPTAERGRAIVNVMNSWSAGQHRLVADAPAGAVRVMPAAKWPFLKFGQSQRFFVENVSTAFDKAGEWFWDADEIRYLPRAGDAPDALTAVLPMLSTLLQIQGQPERNNWVENLQFKGLAFEHTRALTPRDGFFDTQAAVAVGAAIEVDGARHVRFEGCTVAHTGGYGIWFKKAVRNSAVVGSVLSDLGGGGIKIGLANQAPNDPQGTGHNAVLGNTITDTGKVYPGAVGVWVGQSFDNQVAYNIIANTSYSAISVGWTWGYGEVRSGRNKIEGNALFNIGQGMLDDMGAIYTLGRQPGTVITDNLIREVRAYQGYGPGSWGIYLDEGSSDMVVKNNVVVGTDSGGLHLHYGQANTVSNNLFASGDAAELLLTKSDPAQTKLVYQGNLLLPAGEHVFGGLATAPDVMFSGNRVASTLAGKAADIAPCGKGCTVSAAKLSVGADLRAVSLIGAEPGLAKTVERVVAQAGKLPAARLPDGIAPTALVPAPVSRAVATQRPVRTLAPARDFAVDFDLVSGDSRPLELQYQPKDDVRAIRVLRGNDIPAAACLLFVDGPHFVNRYDPHAYVKFEAVAPVVSGKFAIKIDANAEMIYEWRDAAKPYKTGPTLKISARGLESHGKLLTKVAVGQWFDIEVTAAQGDKAGTWRLTVTDAKGQALVFDKLPNKSKDWQKLQWLGFISDASMQSESCIGKISLTRK